MATIQLEDGALQVDARIVAEGLRVDASLVQERMREGKITSLCERGVDEDDGRYRLTFFSESRLLRLVVDESGKVVERSAIDFAGRPLPDSARKPGG
ncbi:MAG TPA: DUF6522 family protein [Caulobacteraceae bacterium]